MDTVKFLPLNKKEALERGWDEVDFVYVIGDAYVDHPSFGPAIISRVLENNGFTVGIISQNTSTNLRVMLPLDLHVLSLPLAFILSQDQTLHCIIYI